MKAAPIVAVKYGPLLHDNSSTYGDFPVEVVLAVILVESTGQERVHGGLTQINANVLPQFNLRCNVRKAACAIKGTTAYLNHLLQLEAGDMDCAIVAYNRGPYKLDCSTIADDHYLAKVKSILSTTTALLSPPQEPDPIETLIERYGSDNNPTLTVASNNPSVIPTNNPD